MKKKFVAFGCKTSTSTHSYIHYAYQRAFESLGWDSYWISDSEDEVRSFDFSNSVILTLGGSDSKIPIRKDCKYILHNCDMNKYSDVIDNSLILQVFTTDVYDRNVEKIDDFIYYQKDKQFGAHKLYQPWATDLLPSEIKDLDRLNFVDDKTVYWVGSVWDGGSDSNGYEYGNMSEIQKLKNSLSSRGINFDNKKCDYNDNKSVINKSYISPAIQGRWQCEKGYIPCRIFKNISYGEFGITNSKYVNELFQDMIVYDNDIESMVQKSLDKRSSITVDELNNQIRFVREKHTYINRIENILKVL